MQAISIENIETYEKFDQGEVTVMMTKKNEDASLTGWENGIKINLQIFPDEKARVAKYLSEWGKSKLAVK